MSKGKWRAFALLAAALLSFNGPAASADGVITSPELLDKIQVGVTTSKQVTELLGRPANISQFPRRGVEAWDYKMNYRKRDTVTIEFDGSGIVRNVLMLPYMSPM